MKQEIKVQKPKFHSKELIEEIEKNYGVEFMLEVPVGINGNFGNHAGMLFYQSNPDTEKGHSNYMFVRTDPIAPTIHLTNGLSTVKVINEKMTAVLDNGIMKWSSDNHDYVQCEGFAIDGGPNPLRVIGDYEAFKAASHKVKIQDDEVLFYKGTSND